MMVEKYAGTIVVHDKEYKVTVTRRGVKISGQVDDLLAARIIRIIRDNWSENEVALAKLIEFTKGVSYDGQNCNR